MNRTRTQARRCRPGHFRPRLENLEDRSCPSCTVVQDGSTLFITGDRAGNRIAIQQDVQGCHVTCDGGATANFSDVTLIVVQSRTGNDGVNVAYGKGIYQPADLDVSLGAGADTLDVSTGWTEPPDPDKPVSFAVSAGAGSDRVTASFNHSPDPHFEFRTDLGAGDDMLTASFNPTESVVPAGDGVWLAVLEGGLGNDLMSVFIGDEIQGPAPHLINANLDVALDGGAGLDKLMMNAHGITFGGTVSLDLDGGNGADALNSYMQDVTFKAAYMSCLDGGGGNDQMHDTYVNVDFEAATTLHDTAGDGDDVVSLDVAGVVGLDVLTVNVESGTGADQVGIIIDYDVAAGATANLIADAGAGADQVGIVIDGCNVAAGGTAGIIIEGGAGADQVGIVIDGCNVADGGTLNATIHGGGGADLVGFIIINSNVAAGASVQIGVDSGDGNDLVRGNFGFTAESRSVIAIIFQGGAGDDNLTLDITGLGDPLILSARLDGGAGFDSAHVSRIVDVANCEEVFLL